MNVIEKINYDNVKMSLAQIQLYANEAMNENKAISINLFWGHREIAPEIDEHGIPWRVMEPKMSLRIEIIMENQI